MRISRVQIANFRNFQTLDLRLNEHAVIVGENKIGKSNLLHALRIILDPALPDSARQLRDEDFWDGLKRPLSRNVKITIAVDLTDYEDDEDLLSVLAEHVVSSAPMVSRLTYEFGLPASVPEGPVSASDYQFVLYGGDRPENQFGWDLRRRIPMDVLGALRDAEGDLANWRRSPLHPLLDAAESEIDRAELEKLAGAITKATDAVTKKTEISELAERIASRLEQMVGSGNALDTTLGFSPTDPERLLRSLRLFIDGGKRGIGEASLGSANLLYITLKALELEHLVEEGNRHHTFLAIEEPEAHLHPHLQRLVYRDFLRPRAHQETEGATEEPTDPKASTTILLTTHSPHIASVSPVDSFVLLRKSGDKQSTEGVSTASIIFSEEERLDLERYLDVTRGEILFARGVVLVEGDAEMYLLPAFARLQHLDLDALGISVCSVSGTNFAPYVKFVGPTGLNIPFAVLTDFDPTTNGSRGERRVCKLLELLGKPAAKTTGDALRKEAAASGIFLNDCTLEVDVFKCGWHKSMGRTLVELAESKPAEERAEGWKKAPATLDVASFLGDINAIGKGRFAQRLATNIGKGPCPAYIAEALKYVAARCS
jgi:putative ATP-dependent endonuclease of OLD family